MKYSRRMFISAAYIVLGISLNVLSFMNLLDSFWRGFGVGFIIVGALQLFRQIKYRTNEEYKEEVDTALNDERNKYLSNKAWAWSGYITVIILAISTVVLKMLNYSDYSSICALLICLLIIIYYISYIILKRKY